MNRQKSFEDLIRQMRNELAATKTDYDLNNLRSRFLGKKSGLMNLMKQLGSLTPEEKPEFGKQLNLLKQEMESLIKIRGKEIEKVEYEKALSLDTVDLTMPGLNPQSGNLHPLTLMWREIEDIFISLVLM